MGGLYQQTDLHEDLARVMRARKAGAPAEGQLEESFLRRVVESVYQSLKDVLVDVESHPVPPLELYPSDHPEEADASPWVDSDGLHLGLGFMQNLDATVWLYTNFLLQNYLWQISPLMGDVPPLSQLVSPQAFPQEALTMHAASLIPQAVARDGYVRRPFQALMEFVQSASFIAGSLEESPTALSRWLSKAPLDLRVYLDDLDFDAMAAAYLDERGPYCLSLHTQLLLDAVYFLLAHEIAHYLLDHHTHIPELEQSRAEEAQADLKALSILETIPGFKFRSLLTLFSFCHLNEPETPTGQLSHPFSRDRILILIDTVLKNRYDEDLRADINAGMTLMTIPLNPIDVRYQWDEDFQEQFSIIPFYYSDSDYCVYLLLYLERPPQQVEFHDGGRENAYLMSLFTLDLDLVLRDRVHPDRIFHQGQVSIRPGLTESNLFMVYRQDAVLTRMHLRIAGLPEWWLNHPDSELAITALNARFEPDTLPPEDLHPQLKFFLDPVEIDYDAYLRSLPPYSEDPFAWANLRLAARRLHEWSQPELAIYLYHALFDRQADLLQYPDLIDLAHDLIQKDQPENAAIIARFALSGETPMRPGFNLFIAFDLYEKGQIPQAWEHAFLEMFAIGKYGEYFEASQQLYAELLSHPDDPAMAHLRSFHEHYKAGQEQGAQDKSELALGEYRQALQELEAARQLVQADLVSLRELIAETLLEICALERRGHPAVRQAFEQVLEIEPRFAPAYIQLARLALLEGDQPAAHEFWKRANDLMPFNHFVFDFREVVEQRNPDFQLRSTPVQEAFERPEPDDPG